MRVVVTGASGNIGSALLRRLVPAGHDVVGLVRRPPQPGVAPFEGVEWVAVDLSEPGQADLVRRAVEGADAVVHLAWGFQPSHDQDYLQRLGVGGTRRVLDAVAASDVAHLVHMSSVGAYARRTSAVPVDESWPTTGVRTSPYSRHKAAAERLLDRHETDHPGRVVTRLRPGIVGQRSAGSELLRYGVPALVPASVLRLLPLLPLDDLVRIPMVHTDDVARAIELVLDQRAGGAFNLASEPPVTRHEIAAALGARSVPVPATAVRVAASLAWHARLQPVDPGWIDLAHAVPLLDTTRARTVLGWHPEYDARAVLDEVVAGMVERSADATPVLRPRSVLEQAKRLVTEGPASHRRHP